MSNDQNIIENAVSIDGRKRWRLISRIDNFYSYEEESFEEEVYWVDEDGGERDLAAMSYWSASHISGVFDSIESARADALGSLPWLRHVLN